MKMTNKEIVADDLRGHMVLECLTHSAAHMIPEIAKRGHCDVKLLIDDKEVDLNGFVEHWQKCVGNQVRAQAKLMSHDLVNRLQDDFAELNERVRSVIERYRFEYEPPNVDAEVKAILRRMNINETQIGMVIDMIAGLKANEAI